MLARREISGSVFSRAAFSRSDAVRFAVAAGVLIIALGATLAVEILPSGVSGEVGEIARQDVRAPWTARFDSQMETEQLREQTRREVPPQYTYDIEKGQMSAAQQRAALERAMGPVDAAFRAFLSPVARAEALRAALPNVSEHGHLTLQRLTPSAWSLLRTEMARVLEVAQREEVRDTELAAARAALPERMASTFPVEQRALAGEILSPLLVANSTYDAAKTQQVAAEAAASVQPVSYQIKQGELIVEAGRPITELDRAKLDFFRLLEPRPEVRDLVGWLLLATVVVTLLLAWFWRFRPELWHRNNTLVLVGLVLVLAAVALKATGDRSVLPYFVPVAAVALLISVLLDTTAATVLVAVLGALAGAISGSVELAVYVLAGGFAGIITVRRGERLGNYLQAGVAVALVNLSVVTIFTLLGTRDLQGMLELWAASLVAAGLSAVVAAGSFALLGNLFGITTSFQLLELANPTQPLLRRLLMETPGTYHHSLMVGNLAERAAEAIGADPLLARVAAYYHDIGKLANPVAFIENQGGMRNIHDELSPEESAAVLKSHVGKGIDLAYEYKLPKPLIAFIPQHHGTALMSYFYARAIERAVAETGARPGTATADAAAASIDQSRFRHAGPKPQSREAAILMLSDGVEASVRSLTSHDEAAIRAMVDRIIRERLDDGQFDECDLTLRDLERIRGALVAQLMGVYHRRIEYPQNKIVELEARRVASGPGA